MFSSHTTLTAFALFDESLICLAAGLLVTAAGVALVMRSTQVSNPTKS